MKIKVIGLDKIYWNSNQGVLEKKIGLERIQRRVHLNDL